MSTVMLEIPESFVRSFGATEAEAASNARLELAIHMYREGRWSTRTAAGFARLGRWQFMDVLMRRKVPFPYTAAMLEQDFAYARSRVG